MAEDQKQKNESDFNSQFSDYKDQYKNSMKLREMHNDTKQTDHPDHTRNASSTKITPVTDNSDIMNRGDIDSKVRKMTTKDVRAKTIGNIQQFYLNDLI